MTNTEPRPPWVSGQWRLAESEIAWVRMGEQGGQAVLLMRLSVACWRADAGQDWRYWPGVEVVFTLAAPPASEPRSRLDDVLGRIAHGEVREAGVAGAPASAVNLSTVNQSGAGHTASHWALQLHNGESLSWHATGCLASCDACHAPGEWLHC